MKPLFISHFWIVGSYFVSVITPVNLVILILKLAINHWNLGLRKCLIPLLPLSGKKFQIFRSWPMDYFASHRSVHFFGLFLVSGRVSAGWRGILYPAYPVLLKSPTTHIPCILQRFWHALSHARIYSSQKQNIVIPEMTSEANSSHSPLFLGREHGNVQYYKLWKFVEN